MTGRAGPVAPGLGRGDLRGGGAAAAPRPSGCVPRPAGPAPEPAPEPVFWPGGPAAGPAHSPARRRRPLAVLAGLGLILALAVALSLALGARAVGWAEILSALSGRSETLGEAAVASRIPRTQLGVLAGAALAVSGAAMQGVARNPLADPGLMGVNAGASLAVVAGIVLLGIQSAQGFVWLAILGAGLAAAGVHLLAGLGRGGATPIRLALAGTACAAAIGSVTTALVLPRNDVAGLVQSWHVGGLGGARAGTILTVLPFLAAGLVLALAAAPRLNLLALGDETALALGQRIGRARALGLLGAVLLCGATTAACGPIGFVGLVVPHLGRALIGTDYRWLMPFSALGGAALLLLADVAGRLVARPAELEAGIVTALVGAPVFIWILRRRRVAGT